MNIVVGIDPGLDGGVAALNEDGLVESCFLPTMGGAKGRMIDGAQLARWISERDVTEAAVEEVHAMVGWHPGSAWRFAMAYGQILGVLQTCLVPVTLIKPQAWKKHYGLIGKDKDDSRRRAIELYPAHAEQFARKMDLHRAEATLIARLHMTERAQ